MGYDRGDSFSYDFEPKGFSFGSKSKGKLSPRSYPIQCERKWKHSFLSEGQTYSFPRAQRLSATMGIQLRPAPETYRTITALHCIQGFNQGGPLIGLPLCRETPGSQTADVSFSSLESPFISFRKMETPFRKMSASH